MSFSSSASQISTAELCLRKWAFIYIEGLRTPPNKFAQFGTDTHSHLEKWLKAGRVPPDGEPTGALAQVMIPHLPPHQAVKPDNVEIGLGMTLGGIYFRGFIDLWMPEWPGHKDWTPRVYDHKTTSGLEWAKTSEGLTEDVQATLYAAWALMKSHAPTVSLQWTYGLTKGKPKSLPVIREGITGGMISERLGKTIDTAKETQLLKQSGVRALDVPYDANGCEAFGGCPFQERCNLSPAQRMRSLMSQGNTKADFLTKLRARTAETKGADAAKADTKAEPAPAPKDRPSGGLGNRRNGAAAAPAAAAPEEGAAKPPARRGLGNRRQATAAAPEAPPKTPETPETPEAPETPPEATTASETPPAEAPKKKRGRKPKNTPVEPAPAPVAASGWTLYVDCAPIKGCSGLELASARISEVIEAMVGEFEIPHYRMMEFGRGAGVFAAAMTNSLKESPPAVGVVIYTASSEARDCLQAFMSAADVVIQG